MQFLKNISLALLFFFVFSLTTYAENIEDIIRKLNAIESRLTVLEKATFNQTTSGLSSTSGSNYDSIITKQSIQITEIQNEIQKLTSQLEEILFSMQTTINTFNTFKEDTEFRFDDYQSKQNQAISDLSKNITSESVLNETDTNDLEPKILGTIQQDEEVTDNSIQQDEEVDENWIMLVYLKDNDPTSNIIVEDKTNPAKNQSDEYKPSEIFKFSDALVDSLTSMIDREYKKKLN